MADRVEVNSGVDTVSHATETRPVQVDAQINYDVPAPMGNDGVVDEHDIVGGGIDRIEGGSGADVIVAGVMTKQIAGGPGDDTLRGMANPTYGGVTLDGGPGADRLDPGASAGALFGTDSLNGGPSHDLLDGGAGDDRLTAGGGDDVLDGGHGRDLLVGGAGRDSVNYANRPSALRLTLDGRADDGEAGEGDLLGEDIEVLTGGAGNDFIAGNGAANDISAGPGNDTIVGSRGEDMLKGGSGNGHARLLGRARRPAVLDARSGRCGLRHFRQGRLPHPAV